MKYSKALKLASILALALSVGYGASKAVAQNMTGGNALAYFSIPTLPVITASTLVNGDLIPVYQASTDTVFAMSALTPPPMTAATITTATITTANTTTENVTNLNPTTTTVPASGTLIAKASGATTDLNPAFSSAILGNPVIKQAYGTCTIASINAKTCVILAGVTGRTISVTNFDVVSAGTPATCTGVLLEDNNGTPVVVTTMNVAQLGSGVHDIPLTAALGVGFGAGTGLTQGKGLQLDVNGSACITATAMTYSITYAVQ